MKQTINTRLVEAKSALAMNILVEKLLKKDIPDVTGEEMQNLHSTVLDVFIKAKGELKTFLQNEITASTKGLKNDYDLVWKKGLDHTRRDLFLYELLAIDLVQMLFPTGKEKRPGSLILDRGDTLVFGKEFLENINTRLEAIGLSLVFNPGKNECFFYIRKTVKEMT